MNRVLHLDPFSGIAGDMTVGALLDAGASWEVVEAAVAALGQDGLVVARRSVMRGALACVKFDVTVHGEREGPAEPGHAHRHAAHDHGRTLGEVRAVLSAAPLAEAVRATALRIFDALAAAEAAVHGAGVEEVHFHEVGALDALADVVATAAALDDLAVERVTCGTIRTGSGLVRMMHGLLPVPAPGTLELLTGFDVALEQGRGELVTPTGAAIVRALATPGAPDRLHVNAVGYGAGTRDGTEVPNCLRVIVGTPSAAPEDGGLWELAANLDDSTAEVVSRAMDCLLRAGARDAWTTGAGMKKGRPGVVLHALVDEASRPAVEDVFFAEAGTLGVRRHRVERTELERRHVTVETPWGAVRVKQGLRAGRVVVSSPEYEDCLAVAESAGVPVRRVMDAARAGC